MNNDNSIERLKKKIEPLRQEIIHHKVYRYIKSIEELRIFMQYHVYAVWDFMCLLKSLQNNLTCTTVPWFPVDVADTRFLINEIVVGEESDIDIDGIRKSHFEMYLDAMSQSGADSTAIQTFIKTLDQTRNLELSFMQSNTPPEAKSFVDFTFNIINSHKSHLQSAVFTFGREDLIPNMFLSIINEIDQSLPKKISKFKYYIKRHIEVDGGHHSHLAIQMTNHLCNNNEDYWLEAEQAVVKSLEKRKELWDGVYKAIA